MRWSMHNASASIPAELHGSGEHAPENQQILIMGSIEQYKLFIHSFILFYFLWVMTSIFEIYMYFFFYFLFYWWVDNNFTFHRSNSNSLLNILHQLDTKSNSNKILPIY